MYKKIFSEMDKVSYPYVFIKKQDKNSGIAIKYSSKDSANRTVDIWGNYIGKDYDKYLQSNVTVLLPIITNSMAELKAYGLRNGFKKFKIIDEYKLEIHNILDILKLVNKL